MMIGSWLVVEWVTIFAPLIFYRFLPRVWQW